jgi:hypothetical protein
VDQTGYSDPPPAARDAEHPPATRPTASRVRHAIAVSPVVQGLLALMVYLTVWTATKTFPLLLHLGRPALDQGGMDPNFFVWTLNWWPYAIAHGLNPLHTSIVEAPGGTSLAWITTMPPVALLMAPITVTAGPVVSYNLLIIGSLPVSAWAAFVLCRRLTGQFWAALAGGAVYGFSAYETSHFAAGQINLAFGPILPLTVYLVVLWRDGKIGTRLFTGFLALALTAQYYLFIETFAGLTVVAVIALAAGYALAGPQHRPAVGRLIRLTAVAYLLALVAAAPDLWAVLSHVPPGEVRSPVGTSLDLASLVRPDVGHALGLNWLVRWSPEYWNWARGGYVGIPLLVLAALTAATAWSSRLVRFLTVMLAAIILVALGPVLLVNGHRVLTLPWARLWYLPIAHSAFPARLMVFADLVLAVIVARWLADQRGTRRVSAARWLLAATAIVVIAANMPPVFLLERTGLASFVTNSGYRRDLVPGSTVVVISHRGNEGLLFEAETNFYTRLAGGYLNRALAHGTDLPGPIAAMETGTLTQAKIQGFRSFMKTAKISAIIVETHSRHPWRAIFTQLGLTHQTISGGDLYRPHPQRNAATSP